MTLSRARSVLRQTFQAKFRQIHVSHLRKGVSVLGYATRLTSVSFVLYDWREACFSHNGKITPLDRATKIVSQNG